MSPVLVLYQVGPTALVSLSPLMAPGQESCITVDYETPTEQVSLMVTDHWKTKWPVRYGNATCPCTLFYAGALIILPRKWKAGRRKQGGGGGGGAREDRDL